MCLQGGGGAFWNNRRILNPDGVPDFIPDGPDHDRKGMWTVGAGLRQGVLHRISWVSEIKYHNPGRDGNSGARLSTGLVVGF
ncbi:MAG: hypothetical protein EHM61_21330 [Acidobacteria bacterium]|nr:MAG: hypothetical protein EHM61_21330 [Acidobacteriota bacterium]